MAWISARDVMRGSFIEVDTPRRVTFTFRWDGEERPLPPGSTRGELISIPAIDLARFKNSRLINHWGGTDPLSLLMHAGVVPLLGG